MINGTYIVALTGGIGSGKSEASKLFAEFGVPIIDLDLISHQLTTSNQPLVSVIANAFGNAYVTEENVLDREKMRQLIFNNEEARKQLNSILHPAIYEEAFKRLSKLESVPYAILSIPLLPEGSPYTVSIDRILTIDCDEKTQIERVKRRNQLSETEIKKIIKSQVPRQVRLELSDDVIENGENVEELRKKLGNLHQKYIKTCIVNKTIT
ncbi:MAG: dephospho-CoA kinase [Methylophilaceae bacterium]